MLGLIENELASRMSGGIMGALRKDLIRFYNHTAEQVKKMSDDEVCALADRYEAIEKGYDEEDIETKLPKEYTDKKCECGAELSVIYVDCETRGDCEIYVCECKSNKCVKTTRLAYAGEWFDEECY